MSDETTIHLFGSDGAHHVWCGPSHSDSIAPTMKHGTGSVQGVGWITFIDDLNPMEHLWSISK